MKNNSFSGTRASQLTALVSPVFIVGVQSQYGLMSDEGI